MATLISDAPSNVDYLGRDPLAKRLSEIITTSATPITLGVYGPWGCGKTSLMYLTRQIIDKQTNSKTVWFNTWQHQQVGNVIIPLLQTIRSVSDSWGIKSRSQKFFTVLGSTVGDVVLRSITAGGISAQSIISLGEKYEKDYFEAKSVSLRIQEYFAEAVRELVGEDGRLVIFIDDLDRCQPDKTLEILESLKVYLSVPGVVFVLGADADVIAQAVSIRYGDFQESVHSRNYMDKLVQMSFDIPELSEEVVYSYSQSIIDALGFREIEDSLKEYLPLVISGLGKNPRRLKKLFNSLSFVWDLMPYYSFDISVEQKPSLLKLLSLKIAWPSIRTPEAVYDLQKAVMEDNHSTINEMTEGLESTMSLETLVALMKLKPILSDREVIALQLHLLEMIHI